MAGARLDWLKQTVEPPVEPDLPICDPHHHFWDRPDERYLVEELLQDVHGGGHNIVSTVFIECRERWRQDGPQALRPIGETGVRRADCGPEWEVRADGRRGWDRRLRGSHLGRRRRPGARGTPSGEPASLPWHPALVHVGCKPGS